MNKTVSVIVPIYNSEKYLDNCIKSITEQTYKNLEIILVNDGSTDNSLSVANHYSRLDDRILVYTQDNKGVSYARKKGFEISSGDLVIFIDSDDEMEPEMIEYLVQYDADIVCSGINIYNNEKCYTKFDGLIEDTYASKEGLEYLLENLIYIKNTNNTGFTGFLCTKLFKREIVKEIFCDYDFDIYLAEDEAFTYASILKAESVVIVHKAFYNYIKRPESAYLKKDIKVLTNFSKYYCYLYKIFSCSLKNDMLIEQLEKHVVYWISLSLNDKMGFKNNDRYLLTNENIYLGKKIILYGAGKVGKSYYHSLKKTGHNIIAWVDGRADISNNIESPFDIKNYDYDVIIIAVESELVAKDIRDSLCEIGIESDKIHWEKPQYNFWKIDYS